MRFLGSLLLHICSIVGYHVTMSPVCIKRNTRSLSFLSTSSSSKDTRVEQSLLEHLEQIRETEIKNESNADKIADSKEPVSDPSSIKQYSTFDLLFSPIIAAAILPIAIFLVWKKQRDGAINTETEDKIIIEEKKLSPEELVHSVGQQEIVYGSFKPLIRPRNPQFSSGPCKKRPGYSLANLRTDSLGIPSVVSRSEAAEGTSDWMTKTFYYYYYYYYYIIIIIIIIIII
jgi:hypothetical protein